MANSIGSFVLALFGIRTITQGFVTFDDEPYIEFDPAYFTVTNDDANQRNIISGAGAGSSPTFGDVSATSIAVGSGYKFSSPAPVTTTIAGAVALAPTIALPPGRTTLVRIFVRGEIQTAAHTFVYILGILTGFTRIGSGNASAGSPLSDPATSIALPYSATPGNPGSISGILTASTVTYQAYGIGTPTAWSAATYVAGNLVTKGGNVYIVVSISGTGTSTTGPTGAGTNIVDNAGGNQVVWDTLTVGGTTVPIAWELLKLEVM